MESRYLVTCSNSSHAISESVFMGESMRPSYVESNILMHDPTLGKSLYSNTISSLAAQSDEDVSTFSNCSSSTVSVSTNHVYGSK